MILIDAHVHIYDLFDLELFFESALKNFSRQAEAMPHQGDVSCFLLLSETPECNAFAELSELIGEEGNTPWRLTEVEPGLCLLLEHGLWPGLYLYIVAGRQLVVEEGLEIAALFTGAEFENRLSFGETFAAITETGGIAVCPWGVGKWLGERGRILREMILRYPKLYLGDSGGRPAIWRKPSFLEDSATGKPVLSGTDPLQISGEERRVGSFGCLLAGGVDKRRPASSLREIIRGGAVVMSYGKNMPFGEFIRLQWLIRKVKKVRDPKVLAAILEAEERAEELGFTETADIETASSDYASRFSGVAGKYFRVKKA